MKRLLLIIILTCMSIFIIHAQNIFSGKFIEAENTEVPLSSKIPVNKQSDVKADENTLLFEDFESIAVGSLPTGWTTYTPSTGGTGWKTGYVSYSGGGSLAGHSGTKYAYILSIQNANNDTWLFTKGVDLVAGTTYKINFWTMLSGYGGEYEKMEVKIGNSANVAGMTEEIYKNETGYQSGWTEEVILYTPTTTGTYYLGFHGYSGQVNGTMLDDVKIERLFPNDAGVSKLNFKKHVPNSKDYMISGNIKNYGTSALTSCKINYQIDNGSINDYELTGINVGFDKELAFTYPAKVTPVIGDHTIKVWTSEPNGVADGNDENDAITFSYTVYDTDASFKACPLIESFTSSTCGPCFDGNVNLKNVLNANNNGLYTLIKYQMNWPGSGDPYYTAESGNKRTLYGVNGVPYMVLNGTQSMDTRALTNAMLQSAQNSSVNIGMDAEYIIEEHTIKAKATIIPKESLAGDNLKLFMAIVEKKTVKNEGGNGETEFLQVMKKFMPDDNGILIGALTQGVPVTEEQEWEFKGNYRLPANASSPINHATEHSVEDFNNLEVVIWLQNTQTKKIYQSATAIITTDFTPMVNYKIINGNGNLTASVVNNKIPSVSFIEKGKQITFTAVPNENYKVKEWKLNNVVVADNVTNEFVTTVDDNDINVTVEFEGLNDIPENILSNINIFPNPAVDVLNINNIGGANVQIVNLLGQVIYQENNISESHQINISSLENGNYIVRIITNEGILDHKVMIAR